MGKHRKEDFLAIYTKIYPFIEKYDQHTAKCTLCSLTFTVSHGGKNNIYKTMLSQQGINEMPWAVAPSPK